MSDLHSLINQLEKQDSNANKKPIRFENKQEPSNHKKTYLALLRDDRVIGTFKWYALEGTFRFAPHWNCGRSSLTALELKQIADKLDELNRKK